MTGAESPPLLPNVTTDDLALPVGVTSARLALGRAGSGLPTRALLEFDRAHALARDAVHASLDKVAFAARLAPLGLEVLPVESAAPDRATYLRRPDFGRRLSRASRTLLAARPRRPCDVLLVVADGLSATAIEASAGPLLDALVPKLRNSEIRLGPLVLASQARVALGDEAGTLLAARLVVMLIGERPGLSAADSLGAYLTFGPKLGRTDAERNCVSNIREAGLAPPDAANTLIWLIDRAFSLGLTGIALKDESPAPMSRLSGPEV